MEPSDGYLFSILRSCKRCNGGVMSSVYHERYYQFCIMSISVLGK